MRRRDLVSAAFFGSVLLVQVCFIVITYITRDTLFAKIFGTARVPHAIFVCALCTAPVGRAYGTLLRRYSAMTITLGTYGLVSASFLLIRVALSYGDLPVGVLYVWSDVCVGLLLQLFWDTCSAAFDVADSKKAFGYINFGSTLGTLLVGFVLMPGLRRASVDTVDNLYLLSVLALVIMFMLFLAPCILGHAPRAADPKSNTNTSTAAGGVAGKGGSTAAGVGASKGGGSGGGSSSSSSSSSVGMSVAVAALRKKEAATAAQPSPMAVIWGNAYYRHLCSFEILATIIRVLIDLQTFR